MLIRERKKSTRLRPGTSEEELSRKYGSGPLLGNSVSPTSRGERSKEGSRLSSRLKVPKSLLGLLKNKYSCIVLSFLLGAVIAPLVHTNSARRELKSLRRVTSQAIERCSSGLNILPADTSNGNEKPRFERLQNVRGAAERRARKAVGTRADLDTKRIIAAQQSMNPDVERAFDSAESQALKKQQVAWEAYVNALSSLYDGANLEDAHHQMVALMAHELGLDDHTSTVHHSQHMDRALLKHDDLRELPSWLKIWPPTTGIDGSWAEWTNCDGCPFAEEGGILTLNPELPYVNVSFPHFTSKFGLPSVHELPHIVGSDAEPLPSLKIPLAPETQQTKTREEYTPDSVEEIQARAQAAQAAAKAAENAAARDPVDMDGRIKDLHMLQAALMQDPNYYFDENGLLQRRITEWTEDGKPILGENAIAMARAAKAGKGFTPQKHQRKDDPKPEIDLDQIPADVLARVVQHYKGGHKAVEAERKAEEVQKENSDMMLGDDVRAEQNPGYTPPNDIHELLEHDQGFLGDETHESSRKNAENREFHAAQDAGPYEDRKVTEPQPLDNISPELREILERNPELVKEMLHKHGGFDAEENPDNINVFDDGHHDKHNMHAKRGTLEGEAGSLKRHISKRHNMRRNHDGAHAPMKRSLNSEESQERKETSRKAGLVHPIALLIHDAQKKWDDMVARQSQTLDEAVIEYKRRYNRKPPLGFDKWWTFAMRNKVVLTDEYDQIEEDLAIFRALPAKELRTRVQLLLESERISSEAFHFRISDAAVQTAGIHAEDESAIASYTALAKPMSDMLPDITAVVSLAQAPLIPVAPDILDRHREHGRREKLIPHELWRDTRSTTAMLLSSWPGLCNVTSPLTRREMGLDTEIKSSGASFVVDVALAGDLCINPDIAEQHVITATADTTPALPFPVFSTGKMAQFADVVFPDWREIQGPVWDHSSWDSKIDQVYWRGPLTTYGGIPIPVHHKSHWQRTSSVRLNKIANSMGFSHELAEQLGVQDPRGDIDVTFADKDMVAHKFKGSAHKINEHYFDVAFTDPIVMCHEKTLDPCEAMLSPLRFDNESQAGFAGLYKYLVDIDDSKWSGHFLQLLASRAVVFKSSIVTKWYSKRMIPWLHYVPVQNDLSDLHDVAAFFIGTPDDQGGHDHLAQLIADAGLDWVKVHGREADMVAYALRLFLEYARIIDERHEDYEG